MERKNENEFLKLKNYSSFLLDLGLNVSFSQEIDIGVEQSKIEKKFKSIEDIDKYIKEFCLFLPRISRELKYEVVLFAFEARKHSLETDE